METNPHQKYMMLHHELMLVPDKDHDEIMTHIENSGITPEDFTNTCDGERFNLHPLMAAVNSGRLDIMKSLIRKGFDPHVENKGYSLIHCASELCNIEAIAILVEEYHVDVDVVSPSGYTAIMRAIYSGQFTEDSRLQIVKYLVERGEDVTHTADLTAAIDNNLQSVSKYLITCGGSLQQAPPYKWSPLMHATKKENIEIAKLLVEAGANVDGSEGRKMLLIAVAQNNVELVEYCCSIGIDPNWEEEVLPAVNIATETESYEVARYLVVDVNVSLQRRGFYHQNDLARMAVNRKGFVELFVRAGYNPYKESCRNENHEDKMLQKIVDSVARRSLQDLCVFQIRKSLGKYANRKSERLPLPTKLNKMIQLDDIPRIAATLPSSFSRRDNRVDMILEEYDDLYENIPGIAAASVSEAK